MALQGAQGIVLGTRLLASEEAGVHADYKKRVLNAKESDTVLTDLFDIGWPNSYSRVIRNSTYEKWLKANRPPPGKRPHEGEIVTYLPNGNGVPRYSYLLPLPSMEGDLETMANYAGQSVGIVHDICPVSSIFKDIISEAEKAIAEKQAFCKVGFRDI